MVVFSDCSAGILWQIVDQSSRNSAPPPTSSPTYTDHHLFAHIDISMGWWWSWSARNWNGRYCRTRRKGMRWVRSGSLLLVFRVFYGIWRGIIFGGLLKTTKELVLSCMNSLLEIISVVRGIGYMLRCILLFFIHVFFIIKINIHHLYFLICFTLFRKFFSHQLLTEKRVRYWKKGE